MSNYPPPNVPPNYQQVIVQPQPSNGLGIAGFIVSLLGIFTAGLLCPIGLLLSFFALFKKPRGFAIAGFIIGLIGTLVIVAIVSIFGLAFMAGKPYFSKLPAIATAQKDINSWAATNGDETPPDFVGEGIVSRQQDGWGHPLHYRRVSAKEYQIRCAGPDGVMDNSDDLNTPCRLGSTP
jgi:hypothetical protein